MSNIDIVTELQNLALAMAEGMPLLDGDFMYLISGADEIIRMRKELDSARRMYCELYVIVYLPVSSPQAYANDLGWDCYKENK